MSEKAASISPGMTPDDGISRPGHPNHPRPLEGVHSQADLVSTGNGTALVEVGDDYYSVLGTRFRRRTRPPIMARATLMTRINPASGRDIELYEGDTAYTDSRVPRKEETFATITATTAEHIKDVSEVYDRGGHVLLVGPTGSGKTTLAKTVCNLSNRNAREITFSGDTKTKDFMWYDILTDTMDPKTGVRTKSVIKVPGALLESMIHGDTLIVNEGNMMPSDLQSLFFQVMDTGQILFSDIDQLRVFYKDKLPKQLPEIPVLKAREGFQLMVSLNPGYIGTAAVNSAWERRFKRKGGLVEMGYLPEAEEVEAVTAEIAQRNKEFGQELDASPALTSFFVAAAHSLRDGVVTYQEGDPPQTLQKVEPGLASRFREIVSTRTIIYWIENYLMNDIDASEAAKRTFLVTLDPRDRRDKQLRTLAMGIVDRQVGQFVGGELAFLEGLEKKTPTQAIEASLSDTVKVVDVRDVLVNGQPVADTRAPEATRPVNLDLAIAQTDRLMMRYLGISINSFGEYARRTGNVSEQDFAEAKQLVSELSASGFAGEKDEEQKAKLRSLLHVSDDQYNFFIDRVENLYKRSLRRAGLLKDNIPISDVEVPPLEHILPVVTESSLTNLQLIDNAVSRAMLVKLRGPTGAAKSTLARTWAHLRGRKVVEYPFSGETTLGEFGYKSTLIGGETKIQVQFLFKALELGYVVLINEFNMAWPEVATALNNAGDKGRSIRLPDGREIVVRGTLISTENPPDLKHAKSSQYAGAKPQNQAVENRHGLNMWIDYPPEAEEQAILEFMNPNLDPEFSKRLVEVTHQFREAIQTGSVTEATKTVLRRFAFSTDELMQLVSRHSTPRDVLLEINKIMLSLPEDQQRIAAPHLARLARD